MESRRLQVGELRRVHAGVVALIAALAVAILPAHAKAASPVLEFAAPPSAFPIHFTAEGGEVTAALAEFEGTIVRCGDSEGAGSVAGPRSAFSRYFFFECEAEGGSHNNQECKTAGAAPGEIQSELIEAELVFINQASHEVGMLLNPEEDTYIEFECGGEAVEGFGSSSPPSVRSTSRPRPSPRASLAPGRRRFPPNTKTRAAKSSKRSRWEKGKAIPRQRPA